MISGSESINDYTVDSQPWKEYNNDIIKVIIEEGITSIGRYALYNLPNLKSIVLPDGLTTIGEKGIAFCPELEYVYHYSNVSPTTIEDTVLSECPKVTKIYVYSTYSSSHGWTKTVKKGTLTGEVYWKYESSITTLLIYGNGNMADNYGDSGVDQPWKDKKDLTTTVRIEYGIIKTGTVEFTIKTAKVEYLKDNPNISAEELEDYEIVKKVMNLNNKNNNLSEELDVALDEALIKKKQILENNKKPSKK